MKPFEKQWFGLALALMSLSFWLPLWEIQIWAPQYPEGLSLKIGLSRIGGNLDQINLLNHYIGMKHITPSAIPELHVMPVVMGGLLLAGLAVLVSGRKRMLRIWLSAVLAAAVGSLYDFWAWGYDYGHDLSPLAPIQIPGMSYQPPLFGHKQLLNIDAYSGPSWGGWALALAFALSLWTAWNRSSSHFSTRKPKEDTAPALEGASPIPLAGRSVGRVASRRAARSRLSVLLLFLIVPTLCGCKVSPSPLHPGVDNCDGCRMNITDARFGGEVITAKGRVFKFDSVICLVKFTHELTERPQAVLVSDFFHSGHLLQAEKANFFRSETLMTPMADGIVATLDPNELHRLEAQNPGKALDWKSVLNSLR